MLKNKAAETVLLSNGLLNGSTRLQADQIVETLIHAGIIEADPVSPAQELANRAKAWLGADLGSPINAFDKASGWSTESWRIVANGSYEAHAEYPFNTPQQIKLIFKALCILANEADIAYLDIEETL